MATRPNKTRPVSIVVQERRRFALALRKTGASYSTILEAMKRQYPNLPRGYTRRDVHEDVMKELTQLQAELHEDVEKVRRLELERLDELTLAVWPAARAGAMDAINTVLRLMERRARILPGMDAPMRVAPTTPDGEQGAHITLDTGITDTEFNTLMDLFLQHAQVTSNGHVVESGTDGPPSNGTTNGTTHP